MRSKVSLALSLLAIVLAGLVFVMDQMTPRAISVRVQRVGENQIAVTFSEIPFWMGINAYLYEGNVEIPLRRQGSSFITPHLKENTHYEIDIVPSFFWEKMATITVNIDVGSKGGPPIFSD